MHMKKLPSNSVTTWICQNKLCHTSLPFISLWKLAWWPQAHKNPNLPVVNTFDIVIRKVFTGTGLHSLLTTKRITVVQSALKKQFPKAYWSPARYSSELLQGFACNASHQAVHEQHRLKSKREHLQYPPWYHTWMNCKQFGLRSLRGKYVDTK